MRNFSVAMTATIDSELRNHLQRPDGQEDLCFATWSPVTGATRDTAIITSTILPAEGDRTIHGNVSFDSAYFTRASAIAAQRGEGLVFLHSHPGSSGWQGMSDDDVVAEKRLAPATQTITRFPIVGLTSAPDGSWSARRWTRREGRIFDRQWAESVRVVGARYGFSTPPRVASTNEMLAATTSVWGRDGQERIARHRVALVGVGSVGSIIAEALARAGVEYIVFIDFDKVERRNLDRLIIATEADLGELKVTVAKHRAEAASTARTVEVVAIPQRCDEEEALRAILDCDIMFSAVDRPWPRHVMNRVSLAALIPVINSGILVSKRGDRISGADWHTHTIGPERRCMRCWRAFDPDEVALDFAGMLDDPDYVRQLDPNHRLRSRANVLPFALSAASFALMQFMGLLNSSVQDVGDQNYHFVSGGIDRASDSGCDEDCPYPQYTALGDAGVPAARIYPDAAEPAEAAS